MRLFVSVDPPKKVRQKLSVFLPEIPGVTKTPVNSLHLTLLFLGIMPDDAIPDIIARLEKMTFEPFPISISGIGAFPDTLNPAVIWAGVDRNPNLMSLQKRIADTLTLSGLYESEQEFHPHITLARVKERGAIRQENIFLKKTERLNFKLQCFSLKKSLLRPEGAVHEVIKTFS
jgi:RNA 2',3'-cyclic 3'-phosphodiesterase